MRNVLALCSLMLAVGAAGAAAQAQPAQQPNQHAAAKATQTPAKGKALARGHRTHKRGANVAVTKTTGPANKPAVKQTEKAQEDLKEAQEHLNKAEVDEKAGKGTAKAEAKGKGKHAGVRHARRSSNASKNTRGY